MARTRVATLTLLAAFLLWDGRAPASAPVQAAIEAPANLEAAIGMAVDHYNPALSPVEVERITDAILRYGVKYELDPTLVTAVLLVESGARPWAVSPKGAVGLMQVMPFWGPGLGLSGNLSTIETNVEAGCFILAGNIQRLGEEDGISAYFWGSQIRNASYLGKVQAVRAKLQ